MKINTATYTCRSQNIRSAAYLGPFQIYHNPYKENILNCLHSTFDIKYFGPGYQNSLSDYKSQIDCYDFVIFDNFSIETEKFLKSNSPFSGGYSNVNVSDLAEFLKEIPTVLKNTSAPKIFIANLDYYAASKILAERLERLRPFIISMTDENTTLNYKTYFRDFYTSESKKMKISKPTDVWANLIREHSKSIISIPHFVALSEFDFRKKVSSKSTIDIPGITYQDRKDYFHLLNPMDRCRLHTQNLIHKYFLMLNKINRGLNENQLRNFRTKFLDRLSKSAAHITTGGPFIFPVRKFYEIPARGATMMCEIFYGASHQGFIEYKNFLPISLNQDESIYHKLLEGNEHIKNIQKAGFSHILNNHSTPARIKQLKSSFDLILHNKFNGSVWEKGEYTNL